MHSSRMRTARSLSYGGILPAWVSVWGGDLCQEHPPPEGTWDQAARQEVTLYRDPLPLPWTE